VDDIIIFKDLFVNIVIALQINNCKIPKKTISESQILGQWDQPVRGEDQKTLGYVRTELLRKFQKITGPVKYTNCPLVFFLDNYDL
jgi:hypothetical protein